MQSNVTKTLTAAAAALLASTAAAVVPGEAGQPLPIEGARMAKDVVRETNSYRRSQGLPPLTVSPELTRAAQRYAELQARTQKYGHRDDGRSPAQRVAASGYKACMVGENVYADWGPGGINEGIYGHAARAIEYWKPRPGDAKNLRSAHAEHVGVGVAAWSILGGHQNYYAIVQLVAGDDCSPPKPASRPPCAPGTVSRMTRPSDSVCVTPESRALAARENSKAALQLMPGGGAYGPNTCLPGLVWREAFLGDLVCVTPERRAAVRQENLLAASRVR